MRDPRTNRERQEAILYAKAGTNKQKRAHFMRKMHCHDCGISITRKTWVVDDDAIDVCKGCANKSSEPRPWLIANPEESDDCSFRVKATTLEEAALAALTELGWDITPEEE